MDLCSVLVVVIVVALASQTYRYIEVPSREAFNRYSNRFRTETGRPQEF